MPLYDIEHITPLTDAQQEKLAIAFTDLHSKRFNTPRFFLNVRYTDARAQPVFRAGRKVVYNRVVLRTRVGEQRTKDVYDEHCRDLMRVWGEIIGTEGELGLRTVWVLGALTTAVELGIARPRVSSFSFFCFGSVALGRATVDVARQVGEEDGWIEKHMDEFQRLAAAGDEDFVELIHQIDSEKGQKA
jgi:hypothetical protein